MFNTKKQKRVRAAVAALLADLTHPQQQAAEAFADAHKWGWRYVAGRIDRYPLIKEQMREPSDS